MTYSMLIALISDTSRDNKYNDNFNLMYQNITYIHLYYQQLLPLLLLTVAINIIPSGCQEICHHLKYFSLKYLKHTKHKDAKTKI